MGKIMVTLLAPVFLFLGLVVALPAASPAAAGSSPVAESSPAAEATGLDALLSKSDPPGIDLIDRAELMQTVERLASAESQGRLAGGPGFMKAAREMADRFQQLGLKPGGADGFFQNLETEYDDIEICRLALVRQDGTEQTLTLGRDFTCRGVHRLGRLHGAGRVRGIRPLVAGKGAR
jgi:hypothetical protein